VALLVKAGADKEAKGMGFTQWSQGDRGAAREGGR